MHEHVKFSDSIFLCLDSFNTGIFIDTHAIIIYTFSTTIPSTLTILIKDQKVAGEFLEFENVSKYFGSVRAVDQVSLSIRRGEFFGVVAMLENDVHRGRFVTVSKCRLLKLHREDFHRLETANRQIAINLRREAALRRAARNGQDGTADSGSAS